MKTMEAVVVYSKKKNSLIKCDFCVLLSIFPSSCQMPIFITSPLMEPNCEPFYVITGRRRSMPILNINNK